VPCLVLIWAICFTFLVAFAGTNNRIRRKACPGKALAHQSSPARNRCNKMDPSRWENIPAFAQLCALLSKHARRRENKGTTSPYLISRCMFIFNDVALWYIGQKFPASPKCMVPLLQSSEPRTLCVGESVGCSLCSVHCSAQLLVFLNILIQNSMVLPLNIRSSLFWPQICTSTMVTSQTRCVRVCHPLSL